MCDVWVYVGACVGCVCVFRYVFVVHVCLSATLLHIRGNVRACGVCMWCVRVRVRVCMCGACVREGDVCVTRVFDMCLTCVSGDACVSCVFWRVYLVCVCGVGVV